MQHIVECYKKYRNTDKVQASLGYLPCPRHTTFKLRLRDNRLNGYMYSQFKLSPLPQCVCGIKQQSVEQILYLFPAQEH